MKALFSTSVAAHTLRAFQRVAGRQAVVKKHSNALESRDLEQEGRQAAAVQSRQQR